jgi:ABC-2 type transport system permease protein
MSAAVPREPVNQRRLFQRLRWRLWHNGFRQMLAGSFVRPLTILFSSIVVWAFVFVISFLGFRFLVEVMKLPADEQIVAMLLGLLFFTLGIALVFSTGLILHGSLFTTPETAFLLSGPAAADQVFAYKFQGALSFSSWAFLLLGSPILIAYGLVCHSPWYFYAVLPVFFLGFVLLPGSVGAILCLVIVNFVPRQRKQLLALGIVGVLAGAGWWLWGLAVAGRASMGSTDTLTETANTLLARISFARSLWLPSAWTARGLQSAGRGDLAGSVWYLALVWSNGLFLYLISSWLARKLYRRGFNRVATGGDLRRRYGGLWLDRLLGACLPFVHPGTRLLIVKDFRTFRRDPQQWGQVLLFTGLLVLYFTNMKRMPISDIDWPYQNGISFLNLAAVGLLLSTYTGRFIYPLLSLEGRKFWVLGLLPVKRDQLLWGKFAFSATGGLVLAEALVLLSDLMLAMPWDAVLLHVVAVAVLAAGLSGLSVGVGACLPNFRESDPSKIAVGFGGTLNLVLELAFLLATLALVAGPWHVIRASVPPADGTPLWMVAVVLFGAGVGLVVGTMTVVVPLRLGIRALRRMEF